MLFLFQLHSTVATTMTDIKLVRLKEDILNGVREQLERQSAMLQPNRFALSKAMEDINELVRLPQAHKNMRLIQQKARKLRHLEKRFAGLNVPKNSKQGNQEDEESSEEDDWEGLRVWMMLKMRRTLCQL